MAFHFSTATMNIWNCSENIGLRSTLHIHITTRDRVSEADLKQEAGGLQKQQHELSQSAFESSLLLVSGCHTIWAVFTAGKTLSAQRRKPSSERSFSAQAGHCGSCWKQGGHCGSAESLSLTVRSAVWGFYVPTAKGVGTTLILNNTQVHMPVIWVFHKTNSNSSGMEGFGNVFERREKG